MDWFTSTKLCTEKRCSSYIDKKDLFKATNKDLIFGSFFMSTIHHFEILLKKQQQYILLNYTYNIFGYDLTLFMFMKIDEPTKTPFCI